MITIENLEVQFDVEGGSEERVFAMYFARFMEQWERQHQQEEALQQRLSRDQQIGTDGGYR